MELVKIKPTFNGIITTAEEWKEEAGGINGILDIKKLRQGVKDIQKVIAVGDTVRNVKVGDIVGLSFTKYSRFKHQEGSLKDGVITDNPIIGFELPMIEINGESCLFLADNDVKYIIEEYKE